MSLNTAAYVSLITTFSHIPLPTGPGPIMSVSLPLTPVAAARSTLYENLRLNYVSFSLPTVVPTTLRDPIFTILPVVPHADSVFLSAATSVSSTSQEEPMLTILPINADFSAPGSLAVGYPPIQDNAEVEAVVEEGEGDEEMEEEEEEQVDNDIVKRNPHGRGNGRLHDSFKDNRKPSFAETGKVGARTMTTFATSTVTRAL
jgi:hypothetical protein